MLFMRAGLRMCVLHLQQRGDFGCCMNEFLQFTVWAEGVLQTEAGFMAFGHLGPIEGQQIVVGEHLDAVVVPKEWFVISRIQIPK